MLGFNFQYLTSYYTRAKADTQRFCFNQGSFEIDEGLILLVQLYRQVI